MLAGGETIAVQEPRRGAPEAAVPAARFAVAYEDEHLIVVDKPAGVVVHPARGHRVGRWCRRSAGRVAGGDDPERAGIVHRLDRDTSGLLVVARSEPVHAALKAQLRGGELLREYLALVEGRPPRGAARSTPRSAATGASGRASRPTRTSRARRCTHFEVERALPHDTLLRVRLETGRTHRSARTCWRSAIRSPATRSTAPGRHGLERQFLHAARLAFAHPVTGAPSRSLTAAGRSRRRARDGQVDGPDHRR